MSFKTRSCIILVFCGCCVNVLVLEELTTKIPRVANLITFLQFVFIAAEGFLFTTQCGKRKPLVPISDCLLLVILFFISSVCNNFAYNLDVPTILHIIIKSGSLVTNMAVGILIGGKRYNKEKYISIVLVTLGISICTLSSAKSASNTSLHTSGEVFWWGVGIMLLIIALLVGAVMGLLQENLYTKCGKHPKDVLYYTHLLPLPLFIFLSQDLLSAVQSCNNSDIHIPSLGGMSYAWFLLAANVITQYICIRSVFVLTSECTALTVNLVLTLRKFISLLLSVTIFENTFNISHWVGTIFVFSGTCIYSDLIKIKYR